MFETHTQTFNYGNTEVTLETGRIARQADGAVFVTMGGTQVLVTAVGNREARPGQSFFPLTVNYQEKTYAAGRIPGGYFRREGRPTEAETLISRLIDRPIRPLFPKGFMNEIQVIATVMSYDGENEPDVIAMLGASAALALSGIPFSGPIGCARVGFIDNHYVLNPSPLQLQNSALDMVVAGTDQALLMVESQAQRLTDDQMLGALLFGHAEMQTAIQAIKSLAEAAGKPRWDWNAPETDAALVEALKSGFGEQIASAYNIQAKAERYERLGSLRDAAVAQLGSSDGGEGFSADDISGGFKSLEKSVVRERILDGAARIDGRGHDEVRDLDIQIGVLDQAHGSALFTRGETQAVVAVTLGGDRDAQNVETLGGPMRDSFMLHYNFPPYSVGETGRMGGTSRRETGHGRLARRGIAAVLPRGDQFPYVVRVVSEITESNGSSSMASVCGTSLALMHAGVPTAAPVAGVAMGLVKEGDRTAVLTDILGDEDHLGDMDFKVAGTAEGITALQMDIKIEGIDEDIMERAIGQARAAILHILGAMNAVIDRPNEELSEYAPKHHSIVIDRDKVRDVIGKGGSTIRSIVEESGANVDIEDDGTINIFAASSESRDIVIRRIRELTSEPEVGTIYQGTVENITDFGAFVNIMPGRDGLVHISQIAEERVNDVNDYLSKGQVVRVKVLDVDARGRIKLTMLGIDG
ncbi:MAG: polyribonucleotide nucleotidyltransferase [Gammaproteobacteria bacterium AqS3]|nr:polyribonucleotide nucleotidyltransferase [Gammaproteobacteria bacterium AqS3]